MKIKSFCIISISVLGIFLSSCASCDSNTNNKEESFSENKDIDVTNSVDELKDYEAEPEAPPFEIEAVDLGLSVMWANANIGATSEEDYGYYYAWGEIQEKPHYDLDNYFDFRVEAPKGGMVRYIYDRFNSAGASLIGTEYDTANKLLGGNWRMPTPDEVQELIDKCKMEEEYIKDDNNHIKLQYTTVTGPNGRIIYFPHGGYKDGNEFDKRYALFWTANLTTLNPQKGEAMAASTGNYGHGYRMAVIPKRRCFGLSVRAVWEDISKVKVKDGSYKMNGYVGDMRAAGIELIIEGSHVTGYFNNRRIEGSKDEQNNIKLDLYNDNDSKGDVKVHIEGLFNGRTFRGIFNDIENGENYKFSLVTKTN